MRAPFGPPALIKGQHTKDSGLLYSPASFTIKYLSIHNGRGSQLLMKEKTLSSRNMVHMIIQSCTSTFCHLKVFYFGFQLFFYPAVLWKQMRGVLENISEQTISWRLRNAEDKSKIKLLGNLRQQYPSFTSLTENKLGGVKHRAILENNLPCRRLQSRMEAHHPSRWRTPSTQSKLQWKGLVQNICPL